MGKYEESITEYRIIIWFASVTIQLIIFHRYRGVDKNGYLKKVNMRITEKERQCIVDSICAVDSSAVIWLFGSRTDDRKKGGDIDIAALSPKIGIKEKITIKQAIYDKIGEQQIDLLISGDKPDAFFELVIEEGIKLYEPKT